jgi:hypothetical protein
MIVMTATGHAVIGTVIAAQIGNPVLAIPIAIASHVLADMIPHWDTGVNRKNKTKMRFFTESAIDVLIGFVVSYLIITIFFPGTDIAYTFMIVIAAQLLDWLTAPYLFFQIKKPPIFYWCYKLQVKFDNGTDRFVGKYAQVLTVLLILFVGTLI